jgi:hypothetical protein
MPKSMRPTCYLAVRDEPTRANVESELSRLGWQVIPNPTGFHLLAELSGTILGDAPKRVDLVVVEDNLPGCRGSSIAQGLHELGIELPIALIARDPPPVQADHIFVFEPPLAAVGVSALAKYREPTLPS